MSRDCQKIIGRDFFQTSARDSAVPISGTTATAVGRFIAPVRFQLLDRDSEPNFLKFFARILKSARLGW